MTPNGSPPASPSDGHAVRGLRVRGTHLDPYAGGNGLAVPL
jgi:hypothetical protein